MDAKGGWQGLLGRKTEPLKKGDEKVYFFEPLEKEISVEDMQKIMDVNEKIVKGLKDVKD